MPFRSIPNSPTSPLLLRQKVGCGVTSLAMVIDYYKPTAVTVNNLLKQGIAIGAYDPSAGWIYSGLISLAKRYGLTGETYDYGTSTATVALSHFEQALANGPVIASVHYKFDPKSTIPHLVVIDRMQNGVLYYNDPAAKNGELTISVSDFVKGWKKAVHSGEASRRVRRFRLHLT